MLDIACHEISILLGECDFIENNIFRIREMLIAVHSLRGKPFFFDEIIQISNELFVNPKFGTKQHIMVLS